MADPYQALYRRYRSKRFGELRGQDHVVRALRTAVAEDRVGHAYLFSGPRGTGKTSTARILAKVLNCEHPVDGEPDGTCPNCVAVDEGRIVDWLLELDAASNNGVANIRELIERIPFGTSGNRKVVILDEVHMLSPGAANALLKSLEEPPAHVVFILCTTDPAEGAAHHPQPHPALRVPPAERRRAGRPRALRDRGRRARAGRGRRRARRAPGRRLGPRRPLGARPGVGHGRGRGAGANPSRRSSTRSPSTTRARRWSPWPTRLAPVAIPAPWARCSSAGCATRSSPS